MKMKKIEWCEISPIRYVAECSNYKITQKLEEGFWKTYVHRTNVPALKGFELFKSTDRMFLVSQMQQEIDLFVKSFVEEE